MNRRHGSERANRQAQRISMRLLLVLMRSIPQTKKTLSTSSLQKSLHRRSETKNAYSQTSTQPKRVFIDRVVDCLRAFDHLASACLTELGFIEARGSRADRQGQTRRNRSPADLL